MIRLAVARLGFCCNSFSPVLTRMDDMRAREWAAGDAALVAAAPDHELRGVGRFAAARPDWHVTVLRCAVTFAGGPLSAALFGGWLSDIEVALICGQFDAVYLSLDGAAQAEGDPIADTTILRRVRAAVGRTPVVATFEVTANLSDEVPLLLDGATARRGFGELDPDRESGADAAERALTMLEAVLHRRIRPIGAIVRFADRVVVDSYPDAARLREWHDMAAPPADGVLDASVFAGFAWTDSPVAGPSALVWTDRDSRLAREAAARVADRLEDWLDDQPVPAVCDPEAAVAAALSSGRMPALLLDVADDPALGGMCDTPGLLRALLTLPPGTRAAVAAWQDAATVAAARAAGIGATLERSLGAQRTWLFGAAVTASVTVAQLSDGPDGPAAVLLVGTLAILVMARRPPRIDRALLERCGIDLTDLAVVAVKGGEYARRSFAGWPAASFVCDCAGPARVDLAALPFRNPALTRRVAGMPRDVSVPAAAAESAGRVNYRGWSDSSPPR